MTTNNKTQTTKRTKRTQKPKRTNQKVAPKRRNLFQWVGDKWSEMHTPGKILAGVGAAGLITAIGYGVKAAFSGGHGNDDDDYEDDDDDNDDND